MVAEPRANGKPTPGPWRAYGRFVYANAEVLGSAYGGEHWVNAYGPDGRPIYGTDPQGRPAEANAQLWAAAPVLLQTCEELTAALNFVSAQVDPMGRDEMLMATLAHAKAVLRQAKGEDGTS